MNVKAAATADRKQTILLRPTFDHCWLLDVVFIDVISSEVREDVDCICDLKNLTQICAAASVNEKVS